jgi:carbon starvation protein CstA
MLVGLWTIKEHSREIALFIELYFYVIFVMYFSYRNQLRMGLRLLCVYDNMNDMNYIIYHTVTIVPLWFKDQLTYINILYNIICFTNYILELKIDTLSHSVLFKYW